MVCLFRIDVSLLLLLPLFVAASPLHSDCDDHDGDVQQRLHAAKMELWARGAFAFEDLTMSAFLSNAKDELRNNVIAAGLEQHAEVAPLRLGPIRMSRRDVFYEDCIELDCAQSGGMWNHLLGIRGGGDARVQAGADIEAKLTELGKAFGQEFVDAIERNKREHAEDCAMSCQSFYCAEPESKVVWNSSDTTTFVSYSFGAAPPEDFSSDFGFPLDLIKVTQGQPLFSADEAAQVVAVAEQEGVHLNEYESGKYKLGGDWLNKLPKTRQWFNRRLESTFFPLLAYLFPEIVSSPSVLRAHSVSLLKYNSSHPRTDVHIDNGILALTVAMTPKDQYSGGGTFFEHMGVDNILEMDVGHGTFRPGSVRHGGHPVTSGTRYILGAFLLIEDRVEHVRRLKNQGHELRRAGDLVGAAKHFEWALAINPKCTTCLKDWAELLMASKKFEDAEVKIRVALELLEQNDSDALFTLGIILSEQGKDDESIEAYTKSVQLNSDDAELCYNLAVKYGARGDTQKEMTMYARATSIDPKFGRAWMNWGVSLAEAGHLEDAETMFLKALECADSTSKAMMNLAFLQQKQAMQHAQSGDLPGAKNLMHQAANYLDAAKDLLDNEIVSGQGDGDTKLYHARFEPQRIECHRTSASIMAGLRDFDACEQEFRTAIQNFPHVPGLYEGLARVLDALGRPNEAVQARETLQSLRSQR